MKIAIYPGTFDPLTNGHIDIIERATKVVDTLIVCVAEHSGKDPLFTLDERLEIIQEEVRNMDDTINRFVEVRPFKTLLMDFAESENAVVIVRGLRVLSDFEYEFKMALMNRNLNDDITTLFMMPHEKYTHISSSLLKEVLKLGGDISDYVPGSIIKKIISR